MEAFDRASNFIIFDVATQLPGRQGICNFGHVTIENGVYLLPTWCLNPVSNVNLNQVQTTFPTIYNMTYFGEEEKKIAPMTSLMTSQKNGSMENFNFLKFQSSRLVYKITSIRNCIFF